MAKSKQNAQELNKLIKNVYNELNETLVLNNNEVIDLNEREKEDGGEENEGEATRIAILVMSCNRAKSVENHVKQLITYRDGMKRGAKRFPIIVSQDCGDQETANTIESFASELFASIKVQIKLV